jgi:hypothetical protein
MKNDGVFVVVDFNVEDNIVAVTDKMTCDEYKKYMADNSDRFTGFDFYMVIACHGGLSKAELERSFVTQLHEYLINEIGCYTPNEGYDFYLNYYMPYATAEINRMCREYPHRSEFI